MAVGTTTQVWFDYATGERLRVPESFRRVVAADHGSGDEGA